MLRIRVQTFAYICLDLYCTFLLFEIEIYIFRQTERSEKILLPSSEHHVLCLRRTSDRSRSFLRQTGSLLSCAELTDTARVGQIIISSILKHLLYLVTGVSIHQLPVRSLLLDVDDSDRDVSE